MSDILTERTILKLIPADGWFAVLDGKEGEELVRLACWALVEERGRTAVQYLVGMDPDPFAGGLVDENDGFSRYVHQDDVATGDEEG